MEDPEGLAEWAIQVPNEMRDDPIWRLPAYRFSLYLSDLVQTEDLPRIRKDYRTRRHIDQLLDAVGSISANITEGYGRTSGPDRAKFFEYAYSSAREARDWLFKVRHALAPDVANERIVLVTRIMKILTVAIVRERAETKTRARRAEPGAGTSETDSTRNHPASASGQHEQPAAS